MVKWLKPIGFPRNFLLRYGIFMFLPTPILSRRGGEAFNQPFGDFATASELLHNVKREPRWRY